MERLLRDLHPTGISPSDIKKCMKLDDTLAADIREICEFQRETSASITTLLDTFHTTFAKLFSTVTDIKRVPRQTWCDADNSDVKWRRDARRVQRAIDSGEISADGVFVYVGEDVD